MAELTKFLNQLEGRFHQTEYLSSDPLEFVHLYTDPWDQEAVALLAALLAYGNVKQIRRSVEAALDRMRAVSGGPAAFARALHAGRNLGAARAAFADWVHRFNRGEDLLVLFGLLGRSWAEHGSLGAHFLQGLRADDEDISRALNTLITEWRTWLPEDAPATFDYLLTAPQDGSCCKRWCMFLRWMGRKDALDLGLWMKGSGLARTFPAGRGLRSDQLILPLDTHTGRISQYLGLTDRKSLNWRAALEVTKSLRGADARDPTRYDFALARLGILDLCKRKYDAAICRKCMLVKACRYARAKGKVA